MNTKNESLEDALRTQFKNVGYDNADNSLHVYLKGGEFAANWQKEKDKVLIESNYSMLTTLMNRVNDFYSKPLNLLSKKDKELWDSFIELQCKNEELLNQIKQS